MAHRISYRHPTHPDQVRRGVVQSTGKDGHAVKNEQTGLIEYVRHGDVIDAHWHGDHEDEQPEVDKAKGYGEDRQYRPAIVAKSMLMLQQAPHHPAHQLTQDQIRIIASKYQDQYEAGHPARMHPEDALWYFDPTYPLANLPGDRAAWTRFHLRNGRQLGYADRPFALQDPIVVVQPSEQGQGWIWDGNHRVAEKHAAGDTTIPAFVGIAKAEGELPPGSEGRTGVRKSFEGDLYFSKHVTGLMKSDAYTALKQSVSTQGVLSRLQSSGLRAGGAFGKGGHFKSGRAAATRGAGGGKDFQPGQVGQGRQQHGSQHQPPFLPRSPHRIGEQVQYQRPDMDAPGFGSIAHIGRHGVVVQNHEGGKHKVRHEHVIGNAMAGLPPDWENQAAEHLAGLGAKMDPFDRFLMGGPTQRVTQGTMERLKALAADGVPIDMKRVAEAGEDEAHKLVEGFAGKVPRVPAGQTMDRLRAAAGKKPQAQRNPFREDDD